MRRMMYSRISSRVRTLFFSGTSTGRESSLLISVRTSSAVLRNSALGALTAGGLDGSRGDPCGAATPTERARDKPSSRARKRFIVIRSPDPARAQVRRWLLTTRIAGLRNNLVTGLADARGKEGQLEPIPTRIERRPGNQRFGSGTGVSSARFQAPPSQT